MPSFKINNWDLDVTKKRLSVSIKAHNESNTLFYRKKMTNKDVAEEKFKLIDDINDLYATLTEGSDPNQQNTKLNFTDDGHLTITQKVKQADREKVFNNDIALEKREPPAAVSQKDIKGLLDKIAELENQMKGLQTTHDNDLNEVKKTDEEQANRIKSLEDNSSSLTNSFNESKKTNEEQANRIKSLEDNNSSLTNSFNEIKRANEEQANRIKSLEESYTNLKRNTETNSFFAPNLNFDLYNNGKRALSRSTLSRSVYSSVPMTRETIYSFRIILSGSRMVMLGVIPEHCTQQDIAFYETGSFGYSCEGYLYPEGSKLCPTFANGDIVSIKLTNEGKVILYLNNNEVYAKDPPSSATNYYLWMYTNDYSSIGAEIYP